MKQYNFHKGDTLPRKRKGSKLPLTRDEYKRMRKIIRGSGDRMTARNLLIINFHTNSSLRSSDVLKLEIGQVAKKGSLVKKFWLEQKKNKQQAVVTILPTIAEDILEAFEAYQELFGSSYLDNPHNPLFPSWKRTQNGGFAPLRYASYLQLFKEWIAEIGLNPDMYGTHSLRSSLPLEYYRKTKDLKGTSKMFAHADIKTTGIYVDEVAKDLASDFRDEFFFEG